MRTMRCAIVAAIVSAGFIAGCGDGEETTKVDLTPKAPPAEFKGMLNEQMKNANIKENPAGKPAAK